MAAGVYTNKRPTEAEVVAWMVRHCDGPWRDELAKEQYEDIQRVVERCLQEFREDMTNVSSRSEPLRWVTHGKPGVGKSKVIAKIVAFFEECLGWKKYSVPCLHSPGRLGRRARWRNVSSDRWRQPVQNIHSE